MRGTPARAIQELAGHQDLTTQRYKHLSPAAVETAIRLLEQSGPRKGGHYVAENQAAWRNTGDEGTGCSRADAPIARGPRAGDTFLVAHRLQTPALGLLSAPGHLRVSAPPWTREQRPRKLARDYF